MGSARRLRAVRLLLLALLVAGCARAAPTPSPTPERLAIDGSLVLAISDTRTVGRFGCEGDGGYSDLRTGAQVTVRDAANVIIGTGTLSEGRPNATDCLWFFRVEVPAATFYTVAVGRRSAPTYSRADLEGRGWTIRLELS